MWGFEGWWWGRGGGGASSRGNSVEYPQILSQLVEVKGLQSIVKNVINILEGRTLQKVGGEGGSTVGGPKAATSTSSSKNSGSSNKKLHVSSADCSASWLLVSSGSWSSRHSAVSCSVRSLSPARGSTPACKVCTCPLTFPRSIGLEC